jgi:lipid-binding SYLF domain-containing protein
MKKFFTLALTAFLVSTAAHAQQHEADRLRHAGEVLMEILNIPDNIPKPVLDKSECVIVIPSVKKIAIGVGGNYGRGAMTCRGGQSFTGARPPWLRWKGAISAFNSAARPRTLCCWW